MTHHVTGGDAGAFLSASTACRSRAPTHRDTDKRRSSRFRISPGPTPGSRVLTVAQVVDRVLRLNRLDSSSSCSTRSSSLPFVRPTRGRSRCMPRQRGPLKVAHCLLQQRDSRRSRRPGPLRSPWRQARVTVARASSSREVDAAAILRGGDASFRDRVEEHRPARHCDTSDPVHALPFRLTRGEGGKDTPQA